MKRVFIAGLLGLFAFSAYAEDMSCSAAAVEKKLAGAAKTSFMKKCERDTQTRCETAAAEKKLAGAAKTSFTKKCVRDGVGAN
ncbi:hypothetical protein J5J83_16225 [Azoarcus sp. L1K30]|uniref:PsiF family protein n=1 Tax=Azoarcus sp. L1K30 TaxID=2820277 RepID=UPI001B826422|nr:PsiF family protein [Azoarcus sp. L1K30]MBR0567672.1 hypothetical protein [Azoarcus sp. L1K30]